MRVVSLLPSGTEIVAALGALETLVGVTHECDYPAVVGSRARVTRSAVDGAAAPGDVDARVSELLSSGASLYTMDEPRIAALRPDVIITQALCDVCAVTEADVRALAARLTPSPAVITVSGGTIDGVFDDIARVAAALHMVDEGEELLAGLRARTRAVHDRLAQHSAPRPRVAVIEWTDPIYAAGHWAPEMVRRAGGTDVLARAGERSVMVSAGQVRDADPEVILVAPCGYPARRAHDAARVMLAREEWSWARDRRVWAVDANGLVSRPGPRLVDGIELFARIFNPSLFSPIDDSHALAVGAGAVS